MKYKHAKVFKSGTTGIMKLTKFDYSPAYDEYYSFIKKQRESGYRQIIITSEIMIKIINSYFLDRTFKISDIEFMVEDDALVSEVNSILEKMLDDRGFFSLLIDKLEFIIEENSIDIKKIELRGKNVNGNSISIYIQVNGIYGISEESFEDESTRFLKFLEGCI